MDKNHISRSSDRSDRLFGAAQRMHVRRLGSAPGLGREALGGGGSRGGMVKGEGGEGMVAASELLRRGGELGSSVHEHRGEGDREGRGGDRGDCDQVAAHGSAEGHFADRGDEEVNDDQHVADADADP